MTETGNNASSASALTLAVTQFANKIDIGTNSKTITHNLGRVVKINGEPYCTDDNAQLLIVTNQGINSFDVALPAAMLAGADTPFEGTFI